MDTQLFISYMRHMAATHYQIRHGVTEDGRPRKAFFRANSEMEMQQGIAVDASYPCMVLAPLYGRYSKQRSGTDDMMTVGFEIRMYCPPGDFDAIENARAACKRIGEQIIAKIEDEADMMQNCAALPLFDIATVRWDETGPINENEYGCRFSFLVGDEAWEEGSTDFEAIFPGYDEDEGGLYVGESLLMLGDSVLSFD